MKLSQFLTDSRVVNALSTISVNKQEFYAKEFARHFQEDSMYLIVDKYFEMSCDRQCLELFVIAAELHKACEEFGLRLKAPRKEPSAEEKRAHTLATIQALIATL